MSASLLASAAMAQDECTSAANVTAGTPAAFNTATATPSADPPTDALCPGTYLSWGNSNDVWFRFVAPEAGIVDFSTCSAGSYDTSMAIYRGTSCAASTLIACNGDGEGESGCQDYYSRVTGVSAAAGDIFYIRIGGYTGSSGSASGPGNLLVTFNAVVGSCATATAECGQPHGGLGCNDPACCAAVCAFNPLCCEVSWDVTCVQGAVDACGLFFYQCTPAGPANNCATSATLVQSNSTLPFSTVGATTDGPNHSGDLCNSGSDIFTQDVWYRVPIAANGTLAISTCGTSSYDNKLAVYDMGTTPASFDFNTLPDVLVGCNDDGAGGACFLTDGTTPYASAMSVNVQAGRTYLVRMGSYADGDTGSGSISFTVPTPCALDSATAAESEACGSALNNGCNAAGEAESIQIGATVSGTFWADNNTRDTDFYRLSIADDTQVTVSVKSASFANVLILGGDISVAQCAGISVIATGTGACPTTGSVCLKTGEYFIFVGPANATGGAVFTGIPCGSGVLNTYSLKVTGAPATCPSILGASCQSPGPDNRQLSVPAAPTGNFLQGCATACGILSGGSADVLFATKIQGANLLKEVTCVSFGAANLRSQAGTTGACGYGASDRLIPCKVEFYRDTDGGDPVAVGTDLQLIQSYDVLVPSGVNMGVFQPDEALCVENETNLVFVFRTPNLFNGVVEGVPAGSGYRAGIGVAVGAYPSNTFTFAALCGSAQFGPVGANAYQWPVIVNGTAGSCPGAGNDCPADLNGDGLISALDLTAVLAGWGTPAGDINGDGTTNGIDLTSVLSAWNTACP